MAEVVGTGVRSAVSDWSTTTPAWRLSQGPLAQIAMGLRECELLGLHSSQVDRETDRVHIKHQLNRYQPWGTEFPQLAPVKGRIVRHT